LTTAKNLAIMQTPMWMLDCLLLLAPSTVAPTKSHCGDHRLAGIDSRCRSHEPHPTRDILLVALLSLGFRAFNLLSLPIFVDEATYLNWALDIWEQRTRAALMMPIVEDGKQPLFMWLAGGASYLFSDPLVAGRMVSVLAGVASAVGVYVGGCCLAGRRAGLLAGLLYAVMPFNLLYDRMALVEALLNAGGIWAFTLSVYIVCRAGKTRTAILAGAGLGVALGTALWTKMPALFMLPFPLLCAFLLSRRDRLGAVAWGFATAAAVFAVASALLFLAPQSEHLWDKAESFSESPLSLLTFPLERWQYNAERYWTWFHIYLPTPLWEMTLLAVVWGLIRWTRPTLLLVGCWAAFTMPTFLLSRTGMFQSRYVSEGVFPLLLLQATLLAAAYGPLRTVAAYRWPSIGTRAHKEGFAATVLFILLTIRALWFDALLLSKPESAPLAPTDHTLLVTDVTSGYGFREAMELLKKRAAELTRNGQPIIVLGDYYYGQTYSGLKMYMRGMPGVFFYVDSHMAREPEGFIDAWKSHHVPILLMGNDGWDRLDAFEQGVPQAKRLGFFPKPGGKSSFRVYEVDVADLER